MTKKNLIIFILVLVVGILYWFNDGANKNISNNTTAEMANPAAEYCVEQGGKHKIVTDKDGWQTGFCVLKDGRECDEWEFFRGGCTRE